MLSGCSVSADSSKSNGVVKNIDKVEGEGWHFFHRSRSYRFRLQTLVEDTNWSNRMLKILHDHGNKQSLLRFNNPNQLASLFMGTSLKDVKLVRKVGISTMKKYRIPVVFYEISSESPYGVGRYIWARMINDVNLDKLRECLVPAVKFSEGWVHSSQCFSLREEL